MSTSEAGTNKGHGDKEQDGTFDCCLNQKITLSKLNDDSSTNDLWIWLADMYRYVDSGCSMNALENEINRSLSNGFWGVWFHQNCMLGDSVLTALEKMKQTDQQQHSDGLLQEFYAMPHVKAAHQRPAYYQLVKFAVEKEAEINFDKAKKTRDSTLKQKATMNFHFNNKSTLPATPAVRMVAPAPEEGSGEGEATPLPSEESDSGESYKATQEDTTITQGDVEIAVRVAQASEAFTGQCFRCNKVRHRFHDEECDMYDPEFLNSSRGHAKTSKGKQAPGMKGPLKTMGMKATH